MRLALSMESDPKLHSKLLAAAAKEVLHPLGLIQKGRSRTWLDDLRWWQIVVEFQPSGWSRGSYLNVGCMWLWCGHDYIAFHEGHRVERFVEFREAKQFEKAARALADRAAQEVLKYRDLFQTPRAVAGYYVRSRPIDFWKQFNAGIACGLDGDPKHAKKFFRKVIDTPDERDWALAARSDAEHLSNIVNDPAVFRELIAQRVHATRTLQKLPPIPDLRFNS